MINRRSFIQRTAIALGLAPLVGLLPEVEAETTYTPADHYEFWGEHVTERQIQDVRLDMIQESIRQAREYQYEHCHGALSKAINEMCAK